MSITDFINYDHIVNSAEKYINDRIDLIKNIAGDVIDFVEKDIIDSVIDFMGDCINEVIDFTSDVIDNIPTIFELLLEELGLIDIDTNIDYDVDNSINSIDFLKLNNYYERETCQKKYFTLDKSHPRYIHQYNISYNNYVNKLNFHENYESIMNNAPDRVDIDRLNNEIDKYIYMYEMGRIRDVNKLYKCIAYRLCKIDLIIDYHNIEKCYGLYGDNYSGFNDYIDTDNIIKKNNDNIDSEKKKNNINPVNDNIVNTVTDYIMVDKKELVTALKYIVKNIGRQYLDIFNNVLVEYDNCRLILIYNNNNNYINRIEFFITGQVDGMKQLINCKQLLKIVDTKNKDKEIKLSCNTKQLIINDKYKINNDNEHLEDYHYVYIDSNMKNTGLLDLSYIEFKKKFSILLDNASNDSTQYNLNYIHFTINDNKLKCVSSKGTTLGLFEFDTNYNSDSKFSIYRDFIKTLVSVPCNHKNINNIAMYINEDNTRLYTAILIDNVMYKYQYSIEDEIKMPEFDSIINDNDRVNTSMEVDIKQLKQLLNNIKPGFDNLKNNHTTLLNVNVDKSLLELIVKGQSNTVIDCYDCIDIRLHKTYNNFHCYMNYNNLYNLVKNSLDNSIMIDFIDKDKQIKVTGLQSDYVNIIMPLDYDKVIEQITEHDFNKLYTDYGVSDIDSIDNSNVA